jgi:hypothetical protein
MEKCNQMSVIMPKVVGYKIMSPDMKKVISEHGPEDLNKCRKLIEGTDNIIHFQFKELEQDETVH